MLFNSMEYLVFFPIVFMVYFLLPVKIRYVWLLISSYYFYMCWNAKYALLILFLTVITYLGGILLEVSHRNMLIKRICVSICIIISLGTLIFFKYWDFLFINISRLLALVNINFSQPKVDIILPVGISFYTFQALGYLIDVYRGETAAEYNFLRYALFVSFFPQLVAGPIERSKNLLKQIHVPVRFNADHVRDGLLTMAYGLFIKVVIADKIAAVIDPIFENFEEWGGTHLFIAVVLFAFQIYCDFDGYTKMAIGSAKILGFSLMGNFSSPYMAGSVKEFWNRWHISLTSWFRDYLYIPLGGNRKGIIRKYINILIVFGLSGLWHGAGWHYVVWGELNGIFIVIQDVTHKWRNKIYSLCKIDRERSGWKILSTIVTFLLVDFTWLFFRTDSLGRAFVMMRKICTEFKIRSLLREDVWWHLFTNLITMIIICSSLLILFLIDYLRTKGISIKQCILNQQLIFRWLIYFAIILVIIFEGGYGEGFEQTQFIYFQF